MAKKTEERYMLFSNGTEFEWWSERNCDRCIKASKYNEKTDTYTKYRCAIQRHILKAYIGDGRGDKRTYDACRSSVCPYMQTERKKPTPKQDPNQLRLQFKD